VYFKYEKYKICSVTLEGITYKTRAILGPYIMVVGAL